MINLSQTIKFILLGLTFIISASTSLKAQNSQDQRENSRLENAFRNFQRQEDEYKLKKLEDDRRSFKKNEHDEDVDEADLKKNRTFRRGRQCVYFRKISIKGDPLLTKPQHDSLVKELSRRCLGPEEIGYLLRKTTNFYVSRGYITTRVYIPNQNLNDGTFELQVIPGIIENIKFNEGKGYKSEIAMAFPGISGQYLNLRHIEQGLEQINRLQRNQARMRLLPGKKAGGSIILLDRVESKFWNASLGFSNSGSEASGEAVTSYSLGLDNLMLLNDSIKFTATRSLEGVISPDNFSKSLTSTLSIPLGYWTFSYYRSNSEYQSIGGTLIKTKKTRTSTTEDISLERNIYRSKTAKTTLSASSTRKDSEFLLEDVAPEGSNPTTFSTKLNISHSQLTSYGKLRVNAGYRFGTLEREGIITKDKLSDDLRWQKLEGGLNYSLPFKIAKQNFQFTTAYQQQYSKNILHPEEKLYVGGQYTVRGYKNNSLSGDLGYYFRNEIHWYLTGGAPPTPQTSLWGSPSLSFAYDFGAVAANARSSTTGHLSGLGIGLSSYGRSGNYSLAYGKSYKWPSSLETELDPLPEETISLSIGYNL